MPQVRIELDDTLYAVLERYADEECRLPTGQATWLVRQALRLRLQQETAVQPGRGGSDSILLPYLAGSAVVPSVGVPDAAPRPEQETTS